MGSLAADVAAWTGDAGEAAGLRQRVAALRPTKGPPPDDDTRTLLKASSALKSRAFERVRKTLEAAPAGSTLAKAMALLVGCPEMSPWPYDDALHVADDVARVWLDVFTRHPIAVGEKERALVLTLWATRSRRTWVPASRAFARLAAHDPELRKELASTWSGCFPKGLPKRWLGSGLQAERQAGAEDASHRRRHVLHTACCYVAGGGDSQLLPGFDFVALAKLGHVGDDSDSSVILLGLWEAFAAQREPAALRHLRAFLERPENQAFEQTDSSLRLVAEALQSWQHPDARACLEELLTRLSEPRWKEIGGNKHVAAKVGALWSWLETARWMAEQGFADRVDSMRKEAGDAEWAFELALQGDAALRGCPASALAERLTVLLDEVAAGSTSVRRLAIRVVESRLIAETDELSTVDSSLLFRRATRACELVRKAAGEPKLLSAAGDTAASLIVALVQRGLCDRSYFLRDLSLPAESVLSLAGDADDAVAKQIAVQMERLLREAYVPPGPGGKEQPQASQFRLLWKLLQEDPPTTAFEELGIMLRGESTHLHGFVAACRDLDRARDAGAPDSALVATYQLVVEAAEGLLAGEGEHRGVHPLRCLNELGRALEELVHDEPGKDARTEGAWAPDPKKTLPAFERVLLGTGRHTGAVALSAWQAPLGAGEAAKLRDDWTGLWSEFSDSVHAYLGAKEAVSEAHQRKVQRSFDHLESSVETLGWPERNLTRRVRERFGAWIDGHEDRVSAQVVFSEKVQRALDGADEERLLALVFHAGTTDLRKDDLARLLPDQIRAIHSFLLSHLHLRGAASLRDEVRDRVQLPSRSQYMAPLIAGVAAGSILVLDVGGEWLKLATAGNWPPYVTTVVLALSASLALLAGDLAGRMRSSAGKSTKPGSRLLAVLRRVAGTFALATTAAFLFSAVVIFSIGGVVCDGGDPYNVWDLLIFGSLSLFLGIFLGLILQGRRTTRG